MSFDVKSALEAKLAGEINYDICGVINRKGDIYPLGSDTKVLSTIFELIARPLVYELAEENGFKAVEPNSQNYYPDFTLMRDEKDQHKIAIDIKTTYRSTPNSKFSFTLGGYTSFIREGNETKNIVFPFSQYVEHWIIGFIYERRAEKKAADHQVYEISKLDELPLPYRDVEVFVNEKWRIASGSAGSGNTTNIGSISGTLQDFKDGTGVFTSEEEFLEYWQNYGRTKAERGGKFNSVDEFREWKKHQV